jgi:hypothetical protein
MILHKAGVEELAAMVLLELLVFLAVKEVQARLV